MGDKLVCEVCGKEYESRSGLRRHMKSVHPTGEGSEEAAEPVAEPAAVEVEEPRGGITPALAERALGFALADLGIDREDVMSCKVYPDRVVIIQGPTGCKRVWRGRPDG